MLHQQDILFKARSRYHPGRKRFWDPFEGEEDKRTIQCAHSISALAVEVDAEVSAVTLEEVREAQESDPECKVLREIIGKRREMPFIEDERGLLFRVAEADGILQVFVPQKLCQRLLHLAHHAPLAGHPGITRQFYTMRR